jgi:phosphoenolpyruvate synthase/pyruvate phosphate dikinase
MLPGFNHNIRHKGLLFHVQTEDSGEQNPYVVTILFFQGNVVASRRSSYEKFVRLKERDEIVMAIMKDQHKDMMKDLVNGRLRSAQILVEEKVGKGAAGMKERPASRTLDADATADKSLDELILDFLKGETPKKP